MWLALTGPSQRGGIPQKPLSLDVWGWAKVEFRSSDKVVHQKKDWSLRRRPAGAG